VLPGFFYWGQKMGKPFYEFAPYNELDDLADWSRQVKIQAGWVCEFPGCGELDRKLLESHHDKPVSMFPELAKEIKNGTCHCIYHHAVKHWDNEEVRYKILARLAIILYLRYVRPSHNETGVRPLFNQGM